jgi:hypothetical protein
MVEVRYRDRLGNNLFQYALGRLIAEDLGFQLVASELEGFPLTAQPVPGQAHTTPVETLENNHLILDAILKNHLPRKIILDGWFQRHEYYTPHREKIRHWFCLDPKYDAPCNVDLVVHVRRTDYVGHGWALPFSFYQDAIDRFLPPGGSLGIVTDDTSDLYFRKFRRWRPRYFRGSPLQTLSYMTHAPRLVISPSTFSWWPAFLGSAQVIACPVPSFGPWHSISQTEINLTETPGFIQLPVPTPYTMDAIERAYQRFRSYRAKGAEWLNLRLGTNLPVAKY